MGVYHTAQAVNTLLQAYPRTSVAQLCLGERSTLVVVWSLMQEDLDKLIAQGVFDH